MRMIHKVMFFVELFSRVKNLNMVELILKKVHDKEFMAKACQLSSCYGESLYKVIIAGVKTGLPEVERQLKNKHPGGGKSPT